MTTTPQSADAILKQLHEIYLLALEKKQYTVATKIQELLGREAGLFSPKNKDIEKNKLSIADCSDEDITRLINELEIKLDVMRK